MAANQSRRRALAACLALSLAACGAPLRRESTARRPPRGSIVAFSLDGRLAVKNGEQRYATSVTWLHDAERDDLLFTGPLGQGLGELVRDDRGARLTLADRREFAADDLEQLSAQLFGARLPLTDMARWILGDAHGARIDGSDAAGRPRRLLASGWTIELLAWESDAADALPTQLDLSRDELEVRLRNLDWQDVQ